MNILFKKNIASKGICDIIKSITIYLRSSEGGAWKGVACLGSYQCSYLVSVAAIPKDLGQEASGRSVMCNCLAAVCCISLRQHEGEMPLGGLRQSKF